METKTENVKVKSPLKDKVVLVKAVIRPQPFYGTINEKHDSIPFYTGTKKSLCVPVNATTNYLIDPLTKEEKEWFESEKSGMNLKPGALSVYRQGKDMKECFWAMTNFKVEIEKTGLRLDLNSPIDYLRYKLLLSCEDEVARSFDERLNKASYIFFLSDGDEEVVTRNKKDDDLKKAYILFGRMDTSTDKMFDFLCVHYITNKKAGIYKPVRSVTLDKLKAQVSEVMENNLKLFISILEDDDYDTQVLIAKCLIYGEIVTANKGKSFRIKSAQYEGTIKDIVEYLNDTRYQTDRMKVKAIIEERMKENI